MSYTIIPLNLKKHKQSLLDLWNSDLDKNFDGRFEWLYKDNPAGKAKTVVALQDNNDKIIGCCSITPRKLYLNGEKIMAGIATDFLVHKKHRTYGPAFKLQKFNMSKDNISEFDIIIAYPNKSAKGLITRAGCKSIADVTLFTKVLKTEPKLARYLNNPIIIKPIGFILDQIFLIFDRIKTIPVSSSKYTAEHIHVFDEKFDTFWDKLQKDKIIVGRSSAELTWRYSKEKIGNRKIFCLYKKHDKSIQGYIVYSLSNKLITIEDIFAQDKHEIWIHLLDQFIKCIRQEDVISISVPYFGDSSLSKVFMKLNFFKKKYNRTIHFNIKETLSGKNKSELSNINNWCFFDADLDL